MATWLERVSAPCGNRTRVCCDTWTLPLNHSFKLILFFNSHSISQNSPTWTKLFASYIFIFDLLGSNIEVRQKGYNEFPNSEPLIDTSYRIGHSLKLVTHFLLDSHREGHWPQKSGNWELVIEDRYSRVSCWLVGQYSSRRWFSVADSQSNLCIETQSSSSQCKSLFIWSCSSYKL